MKFSGLVLASLLAVLSGLGVADAQFFKRAPVPVDLPPDTRVVPRHVYESRQNVGSVRVPRGYRQVWSDDRLNPRRGETSLRPANPNIRLQMLRGYVPAWDADRLNPNRGLGSDHGTAQTNRIWSQSVPRKLLIVPLQGQAIDIEAPDRDPDTVFWLPGASDQR